MISRRSILQHGATGALLAGTAVAAVQCQPTEAPAAEPNAALAAAIERHRQATLLWLAAIDVCGEVEEERFDLVRAAKAAGASESECRVIREAEAQTPACLAADARYTETSRAEEETLGELVDLPVATLADVRHKLGYLLSVPGPDDALDVLDEPIARLMRSIVGGGLLA